MTLLFCLLIIVARIADQSLGTLRMVAVINGRRVVAWVLGFFEVLIWVLVVSKVLMNLTHPAYIISYAIGFATGNYVGMTIEHWLAFGEQVVRVFTRKGGTLASSLRDEGFAVTEFSGVGRDGPVFLLFIQTRRQDVGRLADRARELDPLCYYIVDDIRLASTAMMGLTDAGWWDRLKSK
jgi:uncharacterized protein YebE (UPF0316 family)